MWPLKARFLSASKTKWKRMVKKRIGDHKTINTQSDDSSRARMTRRGPALSMY